MNFLQRNPNDPQYEEFHHGEYEYWPVDGGLKSKSISFPAALVSGLELLAAVAGAGLLAAALTVMYVLSAPLSIHEHTATINASVYNNLDDQPISYVLFPGTSSDVILQEGTLDDDEDTLSLQGLSGGTTYLLKYYDAEQKEIGKFQFTTPGEQEILEDPDPDDDLQQPVDPQPDDNRDPVVNPETDKEPEAGTEVTESTEATTEPTEAPIQPGYRPPVVIPAKPKPTPDSNPDPKPEQKPEVPPVPTPAPGAPEIFGFENEQFISGVLNEGDLAYTERFVFLNVPENYDFGVEWSSTNEGRECIYTHTYQNGTLTVSVTGAVIFGHRIQTTVTVYISPDKSISKTSTLSTPELATATLSVVPVENTSTTFTFNVTATTSMKDGSAVTEGMVLTADLLPYITANPVQFPMTQDPNDPSRYSGTYTADIPASATKMAVVSVSGYWERNAENMFLQTKNAENTYS